MGNKHRLPASAVVNLACGLVALGMGNFYAEFTGAASHLWVEA
jgi:hypothetical protein